MKYTSYIIRLLFAVITLVAISNSSASPLKGSHHFNIIGGSTENKEENVSERCFVAG
jgi:hypothetical protein